MDAVHSAAMRLPFEMRHKIALHCDRNTLARLSRIHSAWMPVSEAALYETMSTRIDLHKPCTIDLIDILAHQPHKAALVRSCFITFSGDINMRFASARTSLWLLPASPSAAEVLSLYCDALVRMINLTALRVPMLTGHRTFYGAVVQVIRSGTFSLKSLLISDEATGAFALDQALVPHAGTLRSLGFIHSHNNSVLGDCLARLKHFANRYSTFALSNDVDSAVHSRVYLYPILDASSPMWDTDLYMQNIQQALWNRDDAKGLEIVVTCLEHLHSAVPRVLRHLAASFPKITSLSVQLAVTPSKDGNRRAPDADSLSAWIAIIAALAPFEGSLTTLRLNAVLREGQSAGATWGQNFNEDEERELLRHIATRCRSVHFVTLPTADEYGSYPDSDAEDGWAWSRENDDEWDDDNDFDLYDGFVSD
ncbi:hypothetical protein EXIGLDRAFT_832088 [Exidia glandulosa HHB12029]|uniref:Uncharacterized protein n=1 Tax=Exidia glandulosa HHB12029 TaxID=1314781 RepID=A0A165M347_EXIGL|nr:hypothetical protein EXIGLDRAFT_832088 [Exidia glandulosa HHB12029]